MRLGIMKKTSARASLRVQSICKDDIPQCFIEVSSRQKTASEGTWRIAQMRVAQGAATGSLHQAAHKRGTGGTHVWRLLYPVHGVHHPTEIVRQAIVRLRKRWLTERES